MDENAKKILSRLESQCARREYCSSDMLAKALKALEGDETAAREVLDSLISNGYVSDLRYASAFAREKSALTGWGPIKIRFALGAKKIDRATIDAALGETDPERASSKLEKLMAAKWKSLEGDPQARFKLLKFGLSRGYEYDAVQEAAEKIIKNEN